MTNTRYRRAALKAASTRKTNAARAKRSAAAKTAWETRRLFYGPTGTPNYGGFFG